MGCIAVGILFPILIWTFIVSPPLGVLLFVGFIGLGIYLNYRDSVKRKKEETMEQVSIQNMKKKLSQFPITQKYLSADRSSMIGVDETNKKIHILHADMQNQMVLEYSDILESEVLEDGYTVIKTSRSSQIEGALIGRALLGEVGTIIGGLSAMQTSDREVTRIDLKIVVNDTEKPVHFVNFLMTNLYSRSGKPIGIQKESVTYKEAISSANHWHSLISVLIRCADEAERQNQNFSNHISPRPMSDLSVADELRKLKTLVDEEIISIEEYNAQKQKLLK